MKLELKKTHRGIIIDEVIDKANREVGDIIPSSSFIWIGNVKESDIPEGLIIENK